jgi:hypothetical protein
MNLHTLQRLRSVPSRRQIPIALPWHRRYHFALILTFSPCITISTPRSIQRTCPHLSSKEKLRTITIENGVFYPSHSSIHIPPPQFVMRRYRTEPLLPSLVQLRPCSIPLSNKPMLSPACPSSNILRNISTPVTTVLFVTYPYPHQLHLSPT